MAPASAPAETDGGFATRPIGAWTIDMPTFRSSATRLEHHMVANYARDLNRGAMK